jgi:uroporphyrinogen decarboxylase
MELNHATMTRRERIQAALQGAPTDRPAVSLWRHFPGHDDTPRRLADATLQFQRQFDVDLIKLMPTGMYPVLDYGVRVALADDEIGTTHYVTGPIHETADWSRLPTVSPAAGVLGEQVEVIRLVRAELGPDTPIIQTIFSPLTVATKLAGTVDAVLEASQTDENVLRGALAQMTRDVVAFGRACLLAGADGFFFATQLATRTSLAPGMYRRFGVPYDLEVLRALRDGSWCTILHLHGYDPLFELAEEYPVDAVNWHDRETEPSLALALGRTRRALVGGIARMGVVARGTPVEAAAEARDAIVATGGQRLIVAPGCVISTLAPAANLLAIRKAMEN